MLPSLFLHLLRLPGGGSKRLQLLHDVHAVHDAAEHDVLPVEPRAVYGAQEELAAVGVRACVSLPEKEGASAKQIDWGGGDEKRCSLGRALLLYDTRRPSSQIIK